MNTKTLLSKSHFDLASLREMTAFQVGYYRSLENVHLLNHDEVAGGHVHLSAKLANCCLLARRAAFSYSQIAKLLAVFYSQPWMENPGCKCIRGGNPSPCSWGAVCRGEQEGCTDPQRVIQQRAQGVWLGHDEALKESDAVKDLNKRHLLLLDRMLHLSKHVPQTCDGNGKWGIKRWHGAHVWLYQRSPAVKKKVEHFPLYAYMFQSGRKNTAGTPFNPYPQSYAKLRYKT